MPFPHPPKHPSANTPKPPFPLTSPAGSTLAKAVDRLGLEVLVAAWSDLGQERASFGRKSAALRALAGVTRASLTSRPGACARGAGGRVRGACAAGCGLVGVRARVRKMDGCG